MEKRNITILGICILILLMVVILSVTNSNDMTGSVILRNIDSSKISTQDTIDIELKVILDDSDTFYAIEEYIPEGWTVVNDYGGETSDPQKLIWVEFDDARDTKYTYTLKAPSTPGEYTFNGIYQFEGDTEALTTQGDTTITIV